LRWLSKIRSETDFDRIRAMLDLSASTVVVMLIAFLAMGLTGLVMPFILKLWNRGWIWLSIVLMVAVCDANGIYEREAL
jgi:hypothetical protein